MITKIDENTLKVTDVDKLIETLDELRPSAKEMFEMLGFEQSVKGGDLLGNRMVYTKDILGPDIVLEIYFSYYYEMVFFRTVIYKKDESFFTGISPDELTAINKQIEELGW